MNLGLSDSLKVAFPLCKPVSRPIYALQPLCPQWVAGFTSGEGYFGVKLLSSNTIKTGKQVRLIFQITQHTRDEFLKVSLIILNVENIILLKEQNMVILSLLNFLIT